MKNEETVELSYPTLAAAREQGPADILALSVKDSLRLLECPTYCEREGAGVASVRVARAPTAVVITVSNVVAAEPEAIVRALREASARPLLPAPTTEPLASESDSTTSTEGQSQ